MIFVSSLLSDNWMETSSIKATIYAVLISVITTVSVQFFLQYLFFDSHFNLRKQNRVNWAISPFPPLGINSDKYEPREISGEVIAKFRIAQKHRPNPELRNEALAAANSAKRFAAEGKHEKAQRIFHHALQMVPGDPDILTLYGEFLESRLDPVEAESLYTRALIVDPNHSKALENSLRTRPLVDEIDHDHRQRIDAKRSLLYKVPDSDPGLKRAMREAYFQHIYHTNAIEGNTLDLGQTRLVLETRLAIGGKSLIEHQEVLGLDSALHFINSTLLDRIDSPITLWDILEIHRRVLGFVDPIGAGQFRSSQVYVGSFVPPEATDIQLMMKEFVEWLNGAETLRMHPIEYAAVAHYRLVYIHPFYDCNGRTARLLLNLILMKAGYPPVIIQIDDRPEYYKHLETANQGDLRPFIRFVARCTERSLDEYLASVSGMFHQSNYTAIEKDKVIPVSAKDGTS